MTSSKSKIKSVVSSSFIRRTGLGVVNDEKNNYQNLAPYDDPVNLKLKSKKVFDIEYLSKTELKVLEKINTLIRSNSNKTGRVYIDSLSVELEHPISTLKKTIQNLEKKGFLIREAFKVGRGGWTDYSLSNETRGKLEVN